MAESDDLNSPLPNSEGKFVFTFGMEDDPTPRKSRFEIFTGIEPESSPEIDLYKAKFTEIAREYVTKPLLENNAITQEEADDIEWAWKDAAFLSTTKLNQFWQFANVPVKDSLAKLENSDDPETLKMMERAKARIDQMENGFWDASVVAAVYKLDPYYYDLAIKTGMHLRSVVVNLGKEDHFSDPNEMIGTVMEETAHLLSKLDHYPGTSPKWVEEMMARYIGLGMRAVTEKKVPKEVNESLRVADYLAVYKIVTSQLEDPNLLLKLYFGRLEMDDPQVEKARHAIEDFKWLGEAVDSGISFEEIANIIKELGSLNDQS